MKAQAVPWVEVMGLGLLGTLGAPAQRLRLPDACAQAELNAPPTMQ